MAGVSLRRHVVSGDAVTLEVPLVELVDRLLHRGVVLTGEVTVSVAGVDLVYLGLSVVLASVDTIRRSGAEI
jgi:gas vesicle structural protein